MNAWTRARIITVACLLVVCTLGVAVLPPSLLRGFDRLNREDILDVEAQRSGCPRESIAIDELCTNEEEVFYRVENRCTSEVRRYACWRALPSDGLIHVRERDCLQSAAPCPGR